MVKKRICPVCNKKKLCWNFVKHRWYCTNCGFMNIPGGDVRT